MNRLADSLLTLLLSWMRALFSDILSLFNGSGAGILTWLQSRWLPLTAVLLLSGLTIDAVVYIIRWRPQYVWRTRLQHLFHHREPNDSEPDFEAGYTDALSGFNFTDTPIQDLQSGDVSLSDRLEQYYAKPVNAADDASGAASQTQRNRRSARYGRRMRRSMQLHAASEAAAAQLQDHSAFHETVYPAMPPRGQSAGIPDTNEDIRKIYE